MERSSHRKAAIVVSIKGLQSGSRTFEETVPATSISGIVAEIAGDVHVNGQVNRISRRLRIHVSISATAHLICDRSLEEFDEPITAEGDYEFLFDTDLAVEQRGELLDPDVVRGLPVDATEVDITEDVRQELALAIPMRRIAPKYRQLELNEMYPGISNEEPASDERWAALKNLKQSSK